MDVQNNLSSCTAACTADGSLAIGADPARVSHKERAAADSSSPELEPTAEETAAAHAAVEGGQLRCSYSTEQFTELNMFFSLPKQVQLSKGR